MTNGYTLTVVWLAKERLLFATGDEHSKQTSHYVALGRCVIVSATVRRVCRNQGDHIS